MLSWVFLCVAICFEVAGTTAMKLSLGLTRLGPTLAMVACYATSFSFLALALKRIDLSVAYAIWGGCGMALIALIGILWLDESISFWKGASLLLIIVGVVGLSLSE